MPYRIDYGAGTMRRKPLRTKLPTPTVKAVLIILVLIAGALTIKIVGLSWVQDVLLPGDPAVTAAALENMTEGLRSGESLLDAVTAFCREIIANAQ